MEDNIKMLEENLAHTKDTIGPNCSKAFREELSEFVEFVAGCQTTDNITRTDILKVKFATNQNLRLHKAVTLFPTGALLLKLADDAGKRASKNEGAVKDMIARMPLH